MLKRIKFIKFVIHITTIGNCFIWNKINMKWNIKESSNTLIFEYWMILVCHSFCRRVWHNEYFVSLLFFPMRYNNLCIPVAVLCISYKKVTKILRKKLASAIAYFVWSSINHFVCLLANGGYRFWKGNLLFIVPNTLQFK